MQLDYLRDFQIHKIDIHIRTCSHLQIALSGAQDAQPESHHARVHSQISWRYFISSVIILLKRDSFDVPDKYIVSERLFLESVTYILLHYITFCPDCIPTVVHPENVEPCESDALPVSMLSDAENHKRKFDQI